MGRKQFSKTSCQETHLATPPLHSSSACLGERTTGAPRHGWAWPPKGSSVPAPPQGLCVLCVSSHHQAPADTPGGKREQMMAPFTRAVPGGSVGARSLSSFQHGSGTCTRPYSHRAAAGLYPPAAASRWARCPPQAPASLKA